MLFAQLTVNGLIAGAIYALVAVGFSLIYSTCRFVHFAHGAVIAFGGYLSFLFFTQLSIPFYLSAILAIGLSGLLGLLMDMLVYEPLRKKGSSVILLIASFGLLILLESLLLLSFGADVKSIGLLEVRKGWELFGAVITPLQVTMVLISLGLLVALYFFMKKTKLGKAMRAVADNKDVAEILGISSRYVYRWSFVIGSCIAGIAGILVGLEQNLEPAMGSALMVKGFTGAVIGGIGSVPGAVLGSFLLGLAENYGIGFPAVPSGYKDAIAFIILFIFLLIRPQGILGIKRGMHK